MPRRSATRIRGRRYKRNRVHDSQRLLQKTRKKQSLEPPHEWLPNFIVSCSESLFLGYNELSRTESKSVLPKMGKMRISPIFDASSRHRYLSPNGKKVREKYICMRHLHRNSQRTEPTYENIFRPAGNDCNAQFGFVFVGADDDHNNDSSRNYGYTADSHTADDNYPRHALKSGQGRKLATLLKPSATSGMNWRDPAWGRWLHRLVRSTHCKAP